MLCNFAHIKLFKYHSLPQIIMQVNVLFDRENMERKVEIGNNSSVGDLLSRMNVNPVTVIVSRDGAIITEDEPIMENDNIRLFSVISGG